MKLNRKGELTSSDIVFITVLIFIILMLQSIGFWSVLDELKSNCQATNTSETQCNQEAAKYYNHYWEDKLQWECIEWRNKTIINPEWIENCCIDSDVKLTDEENEKNLSGKIDDVEVGFKLSKPDNKTAVYLNEICFDIEDNVFPEIHDADGTVYSSISIGNQSIDMELCHITPKMIYTTETYCVLKRLRGPSEVMTIDITG